MEQKPWETRHTITKSVHYCQTILYIGRLTLDPISQTSPPLKPHLNSQRLLPVQSRSDVQ